MFGIGPMEAIIIALVAVIFVGPDKLPGLLKKFGRFYVQAKRHANDVKSSFDQAIHEAERDLELEKIRELQRQIQESTNLAHILDAEHQDKSQNALPSGDPGHTPDGRLIDSPEQQHEGQNQSAMPPGEVEETVKTAYHEGHLPAHTRNEDRDPFASEALTNRDLAEPEPEAAKDPGEPLKKV